jgi:outer membrane lipoprotein carrier protein
LRKLIRPNSTSVFKRIFSISLLIAILFAFLVCSATPPNDLNKIIDGMQAKYGSMTSMAADFRQHYVDQSGRSLIESGHVIIKRPNKMRWDYQQPEKKLFVSDGQKLYFYVPEDKQVTVSSVKEGTDPRTPFMFLLRRSNLRKDFESITLSNESPIFAGDVVLSMIPRRAPADFKKLTVEVNPQTNQIRRMTNVDAAGTTQTFTFDNIKENYAASESDFKFTPPPGVQVIKGS